MLIFRVWGSILITSDFYFVPDGKGRLSFIPRWSSGWVDLDYDFHLGEDEGWPEFQFVRFILWSLLTCGINMGRFREYFPHD